MIKKIFPFLILPVSLYAQSKDTVKTKDLGSEEVMVVKAYQPALSDAFKISDQPTADTTSVLSPEFNYALSPKKTETNYNITPIKPVRIKDDNIKKLYRGFVKAGYGNYNTPYAELFYNALRSKTFDAGIHLKHISSSGTITGAGKPDYSQNALDLFGKKFLENKGALSARINLNRNVVHTYGYDATATIFSKAETELKYNFISGEVGYQSDLTDKDKIQFGVGLDFYHLSGTNPATESTENNFALKGFAGKYLNNSSYVKMNVRLDFSKLQQPLIADLKNNILKFEPRYEFSIDQVDISAGANIAIETQEETHYHLYPHIYAKYKIIEDAFSIFGQLTGNLERNSYRSITDVNPFVYSPIGIFNTNDKFDLRGGFTSKLDKEISVTASAAIIRKKGELFFMNATRVVESPITFIPVADDITLFNLHGEIEYSKTDKAQFWLKADYFGYDNSSLAKPFYKPAFEMTFAANYVMQDKIIIKSDWFFRGVNYYNTGDVFNNDNLQGFDKLSSWVDASLGIEYRYTKVLSVFLNINNIGAVKYYRWYKYPQYRFNVLGGLSYSF